jgi:hypothetical protein
VGTPDAQVVGMERLTLAVRLAAVAATLTAVACSSSSNPGAPDGSTTTPDAESDAFPEDSGPNACTDASVVLIKASNYDQSCTVDTDCRLIAEGNACTPCAFNCPSGEAINASALMKYNADIANTPAVAQEVNGQTCLASCGYPAPACCVAGKCLTSPTGQCPVPTDAGDAGDAASDASPDATGSDAASDSGSADGSTEASSDAHAE